MDVGFCKVRKEARVNIEIEIEVGFKVLLTLVVEEDCDALYYIERSAYHSLVVYFADCIRSQP